MALLADYNETFSSGRRYFHLAGFSVDRTKGEVNASFTIYASKDARDAFKKAIIDESAILAEIKQMPEKVAPEVIGPVHDRLMAVRVLLEENKFRAEFPATISNVDPDNVTPALVYERVSPALINAENI